MSEFDAWRDGVRARFAERRVAAGGTGRAEALAAADGILTRLLPHGLATPDQHVYVVRDGDPAGRPGSVWLQVSDDRDGADAFVYDVVLGAADPAEAMRAVEQRAVELGAQLIRVHLFASDHDACRMVDGRGYVPAVTQMRLRLDGEGRSDAGRPVVLRPMRDDEFDVFRRGQEDSYAEDLTRSGAVPASEARRKAVEELAELLPEGMASPGHLFWTAVDSDRQVGLLWLEIEDDADGAHAFVLDVLVSEPLRRQGYGRAIMRAGEAACRDRGATTIGLSVFGFNHAARALYDDLGYRVTEQVLRKRL
ncbi:MAG: GNAT family N-acetyltransferase [Nocardioidaceae bacterium]